MAAAISFRFDRPVVLDPAGFVDVVNIEVAKAATARPKETVEILDLVEKFARIFRRVTLLGAERCDGLLHPIRPQQNDVSEFTILNPLLQLLASFAMTAHQANRDFHPFFFASSFSASIRRAVGPSVHTGFSMKTLTPLSMAYLKWTQRNAGGV
jgi:hypothetical protein